MITDNNYKYVDVTKEWFDKATPNSHKIIIDNIFIDDFGVKHPIKNKEKSHIILSSSNEYNVAILIEKTFGGDIHLIPRITDISNTGLSTPTPDFKWNNEKWDLKTPGRKGKFKNTLERFLKKKNTKNQAVNLIINYINYPDKSNNNILKVITETLNQKHRNWVKSLIIIRGREIIAIYIKKEPLDEQRPNR